MSVIDKSLRTTGLQMVGDKLPKDQRTVKQFQRLIAAVRAAEAQVQDNLTESQNNLNKALQNNLELHEHCRRLEGQLVQLRLKDGMEQIKALTVSDKTILLECSAIANGGSSK